MTADSDFDSVFLTWKSPEDDGGYQIESYCILMKEANGDWATMAYCNGYEKTYKVEYLNPKTPYYFAVAAVNKIGLGLTLEMDSAIVLKERLGRTSSFSFIKMPSQAKDICVSGVPVYLVPRTGDKIPRKILSSGTRYTGVE